MSISSVNYGYGYNNSMNASEYSDLFKRHYGNFQPSNREPDKDYSPAIATGIVTGLAAGAIYLLSRGKFKLGSIFKGTKAATPELKLLTAGEKSSKVAATELKLLPAPKEIKLLPPGERQAQLALPYYETKLLPPWQGNTATDLGLSKKLLKAKSKNWGYGLPPVKQRIQNTSVSSASRPITNAREAEILEGIDLRHVNADTRRLVENASRGTVTPRMQAEYDRQIAFQSLTQEQKIAKANLDMANRAQRAELNTIGNIGRGAEKLTARTTDGWHVNPNGNMYFTRNGQVTQIRTANPNSLGEYTITDPVKIAKHMSKHNVNFTA